MPEEITWAVTERDGTVTSPPVSSNKHPFVTEKRITEGLSAGQQEFIRVYNSMRKMLQDNNLMEKK